MATNNELRLLRRFGFQCVLKSTSSTTFNREYTSDHSGTSATVIVTENTSTGRVDVRFRVDGADVFRQDFKSMSAFVESLA